MANAVGRRLSVQWIRCSKVATLLLTAQFLCGLSSGGVSAGSFACSTARGGQCMPSQPSRPACADGVPCTARNTGDPASLYNPAYVSSRNCTTWPSNSPSPTHTVAEELTVILYPIGRDKKYSLYVSWQTTNADDITKGFYIWLYKCSGSCWFQNGTVSGGTFPIFDSGKYECLPIQNPSARSVLFDGAVHSTESELLQCKDGKLYTPHRCNSSALMTVMVVPRPRSPYTTFSELLATSSFTFAWDNLDACWPTLYSARCSLPVFIRPVEDFNVTAVMVQGRGIDICVSWLCVPGDVEYIVTITDTEISTTPNCTSPGLNPPCVVARDTTQVTIEGLDSDIEYSISVQVAPRCNGVSFAQHYVGCRSEDCCQAKRIGPISSGNSSSLSVTVEPSQISAASSCIGKESSSTRINPSKTKYRQSSTTSYTQISTVTITTAPPTQENQTERGNGGRMGTAIGVAVAAVFLLFFIVSATVIICYFNRRRLKLGQSLTSASSLTESRESSLDGIGDGRRGYFPMLTVHHMEDPPAYALTTTSGTDIAGDVQSSEGAVSQTTIEVGSLEGGSGTASELEKISGASLSLEDDAFENLAENQSEKVRDSKELAHEVANGCGRYMSHGGLPEKAPERARSESVRVKTPQMASSFSTRRRPRSLSTSQATQQQNGHSPSALILYSKGSPDLEQKTIQQLLLSDLTQYNVRTVSEDTSTPRECPASWLEAQMRDVSAVFCVCNKAFDQEWENITDSLSGLIPVFKQLCHGLVTPSCGKNQLLRDKIAIVLPRDGDLEYVPTYLNSRRKFLLQTQDLVKMARFAAGLPEYQCIATINS